MSIIKVLITNDVIESLILMSEGLSMSSYGQCTTELDIPPIIVQQNLKMVLLDLRHSRLRYINNQSLWGLTIFH